MKQPKLEFEVMLLGKSKLAGVSVNKPVYITAFNLENLLGQIEELNKINPPGGLKPAWCIYYLTDAQYQAAKAQ